MRSNLLLLSLGTLLIVTGLALFSIPLALIVLGVPMVALALVRQS